FQNSVIKRIVVCNNVAAFGNFNDAFGNFKELRSLVYHGIIYTGKLYNKRLKGIFGINQTYRLIYNFNTVKLINSNFGNSFFIKLPAGGFYIYYCVHSSMSISISKINDNIKYNFLKLKFAIDIVIAIEKLFFINYHFRRNCY